MTPRDALDVARVLLKKARQDEALVRKIGSDTDIADEIVGFHAQHPEGHRQAVEKCLKAVLSARETPYKRTHELNYLIGLVDEETHAPAALAQADTLTDWAVEFRYEGDDPPPLDRVAALALVVQLREWAEAKVTGG